MAAIIILFAISPVFEDPNYVEPERYTFAECEAIDFEDMYCIYDFKWTREYADGGTISEYAEFDPFVDLPDLGDKYTRGTGLFTTTTTVVGSWSGLPLAYGTHDYVSGYAEHDEYIEPKLDEFGLSFVDDELARRQRIINKNHRTVKT